MKHHNAYSNVERDAEQIYGTVFFIIAENLRCFK